MCPPFLKFIYLNYRIHRLCFYTLFDYSSFDDETNLIEFGRQDIIYSVGFFDYLPDEFLIKLLSSLYNLLDHGGTLIAAFKDANRYRSQEYHWILNWDGFLQRREEDFRNILSVAGIPNSAIKEEREESGIIIFYTISKL